MPETPTGGTDKPDRPNWVCPAETNNPYLSDLLSFAAGNYRAQTDFFLRHRDIGIRNLALVVTGEFAVIGFHFANGKVPVFLTSLVLLFLAVSGYALAESAWRSCKRSFVACLECAVLVTKTIWAMGLTTRVPLILSSLDFTRCPVPRDESLYVWRYLKDACEQTSTEEFIENHLSCGRNGYAWTRIAFETFRIGAVLIGVGASIAVWFCKPVVCALAHVSTHVS